jgi:predicted ATPase
MPSSIREHYAALIAAGEIERDPAQETVLAALVQLEGNAESFKPLLAAFDGFVAQQAGYRA